MLGSEPCIRKVAGSNLTLAATKEPCPSLTVAYNALAC